MSALTEWLAIAIAPAPAGAAASATRAAAMAASFLAIRGSSLRDATARGEARAVERLEEQGRRVRHLAHSSMRLVSGSAPHGVTMISPALIGWSGWKEKPLVGMGQPAATSLLSP